MMEHGLYRIFFELAFANIFSLLVIMETLSYNSPFGINFVYSRHLSFAPAFADNIFVCWSALF